MTTAPWFKDIVKKCDGPHVHGPRLRGLRAKSARAYQLVLIESMEHDRQDLTRPSSRRIQRSVAKSSGPPSNPGVLASSSQDGANAVPCAVDGGAHSRLAVQADARVTEELGTAEIEPGVSTQEALNDPSTRAQATRWRSGSEGRRATAILASIMLESLHSIWPAWTMAGGGDPPLSCMVWIGLCMKMKPVMGCQTGSLPGL